MQTILGAGGVVGQALASELKGLTQDIRLVSRTPQKIHPEDILFPANLCDAQQVMQAVEGSDVVYLTVGLNYNYKIWKRQWPQIMQNALNACQEHQARLVFFDNMYMYDCMQLSHMTEETSIRPCSRKGKVRAEIADMLIKAVEQGKVEALIARSADFISLKNSMLVELIYKNFIQNKPANWFASLDKIHTFTYVPDGAKATALLGNSREAYNQVWHLPTDSSPNTGADWVKLFAENMGCDPKAKVMPRWLLGVLSLFVPVLRELKEMTYQYEQDYFFDSSKIEKAYGLKATKPEESIARLIQELRARESI